MANLLLLSASIGAGHVMAAKALQEAVEEAAPKSKIKQFDILEVLPGRVKTLFLQAYLKSLLIVPQVYAAAYSWGNKSATGYFKTILDAFLAKQLAAMVTDFSPDCVLCTHAAPMGAVCKLKREGRLGVPVYGIVTDFVVHRFWLHSEAQAFFLAHDSLKKTLLAMGVSPERLFAYGIPVRRMFTVGNPARMSGRPNRKKKLTLLICGGGTGLLPMERILTLLDRVKIPLMLYFVAGRNPLLYERLREKAGQSRHRIQVFQFVEDMSSLIDACDLVISKAGGLTSAEVLSRQKPLVIYCPFPGQETANAMFLERQQVAEILYSDHELITFLNRLLQEPTLLEPMQRQAALLAKPAAASDIVKRILQGL